MQSNDHLMFEDGLRVLIVCENASLRLGGEPSKGFYFFDRFLERGVETWLIVHERCREELEESFPDELARIRFVRDRWAQRVLWRLGKSFPKRLADIVVEPLICLITQWTSRSLARRLVREESAEVVLQPTPIGPRFPTLIFGIGAPVAMGPLCGGMDFPPAFRNREGRAAALLMPVLSLFSNLANLLIPGRILAETLIVANERTRRALPFGAGGEVFEVVESGVDLASWRPKELGRRSPGPIRFMFAGAVRQLKGIDLLVEAFARIVARADVCLEIVGDGKLRTALEARVRVLGVADRILFTGWLSREGVAARLRCADVFVFPSLKDCGGNAVLEAMAVGLPVIAARWGGPAQYVDETCGILIDPSAEEPFIKGLAEAMLRLANDRHLRLQMGRAGLVRVRSHHFDWDKKTCVMLRILRETVDRAGRRRRVRNP